MKEWVQTQTRGSRRELHPVSRGTWEVPTVEADGGCLAGRESEW